MDHDGQCSATKKSAEVDDTGRDSGSLGGGRGLSGGRLGSGLSRSSALSHGLSGANTFSADNTRGAGLGIDRGLGRSAGLSWGGNDSGGNLDGSRDGQGAAANRNFTTVGLERRSDRGESSTLRGSSSGWVIIARSGSLRHGGTRALSVILILLDCLVGLQR